MKKLYTFASLICIPFAGAAQCAPPTALALSVNGNQQVVVTTGGMDFGPLSNLPGISLQNGLQNQSLMYSMGNWIGGISSDEQLYLSVASYQGNTEVDFFTGPLISGEATTDPQMCTEFDQVWFYNRTQAEFHLAYFTCLADPNCDQFTLGYTIPESFYNYPAQTVTADGIYIDLLPFIDFNGDNNYNPSDGDCPAFYGLNGIDDCCNSLPGDVCSITISNDNGNEQAATGGPGIGVELHKMMYYYYSPTTQNTVFTRNKWINRGTLTLHDTYLAWFMDGDVGGPFDDQFGADPGRDVFFFYNGDNSDGQFGIGNNIPVVAYKLLQGPPMDADNEDNDADGVVDNETHHAAFSLGYDPMVMGGTPSTSMGYYSWMTGLFVNGSPIAENGEEVSYQQAGIPDGSENLVPTDVRQMVSSGGFTLEPGQEFCTDALVHYRFGTGDDHLSAFTGLGEKMDSLQTAFDACFECLIPAVKIFAMPANGGYYFLNLSSADSYFWDFGDGTTSNDQFPQHAFAESGTYTVELTVTNDCGSSTGVFTIDAVVSVHDHDLQVAIYPNPADEAVNVSFDKQTEAAFEVYTFTGSLIYTQTNNGTGTTLPVADLANGVYLLKIVTKEGHSFHKIAVKH